MCVEIVRFRKDEPGAPQEQIVQDFESGVDRPGSKAVCTTWSRNATQASGRGLVQEVRSGVSWTAVFTVRGPLQKDGWSHAAIIEEMRSLMKASKLERGETGLSFGARIKLVAK